jgi:MFS family permease
VLGLPGFYAYFDLDPSGESSGILGATSGLFAGGGAIGALFTHWLADRSGRIRAIQISAAICAVSGAIQAGSAHIAMFLVGRFVSGLGVGLIVTLVPIYQSEISPAESRGKVVGSHGTLIVSGYVSLFLFLSFFPFRLVVFPFRL